MLLSMNILVEHANNAGSAEARNIGLREVLGQYYVFVDPVPETALDILYNHIDESGADIVKGSNWYKEKTTYSVNHIESHHNNDCIT